MSLPIQQREKIRLYLLEHIERNDKNLITKVMETFSVSKTTVYNHLRKMEEETIIQKVNDTDNRKYKLVNNFSFFNYSLSNRLEEDRIYTKDIAPLVSSLPKNVQDIWRYAFTEMMNNAIEHSMATNIQCLVSQNYLNTGIYIVDDGIGIFRKIQKYFQEELEESITLDEAVDALFPGKLTTARKNHSGEGIFFTSRALDRFYIYSDKKIFAHKSFSDYRIDAKEFPKDSGTAVDMTLSNTSTKLLKEVFDMFTDPDKGFFKTQIPIAHMFENGYPVSRSEARRLGTFMEGFEEITFDFLNVPQIGQAFTHELFVVFQNNHPTIKIHVANANSDVSNMIRRVKNS